MNQKCDILLINSTDVELFTDSITNKQQQNTKGFRSAFGVINIISLMLYKKTS